jgi:uncharacterized membrane protein
MKASLIAGIILVVIGIIITARGLSYHSSHDVVKVGDIKASVEERRSIPPWVGGLVIVGGAALIYFGARRGPSSPSDRSLT